MKTNRLMARIAMAATLAVASLTPAWSQSVAVTHGPMIGAVTGQTATVWFRLGGPAQVRVRYHGPNTTLWNYSAPVTVTPDTDGTARIPLTALLAGKAYTYNLGITGPDGQEVWTGDYKFKTFNGTATATSFAILSDFSNKLKDSPALRDALSRKPGFLVVMGDLDHRNPATDPTNGYYPPEDAPQVLADLRAMHRDTRDFATPIGNAFASGLIGAPDSGLMQIPMYYGWDDHDFCANNADATCPFAPQAVQAYREYYVPSSDNGIDNPGACPQASTYQRIDQGKLASVFLLDARSARTSDGTSMLGACQYDWLTKGLAATKATWKIILSPVPFNPTTKTWDAWGHYPTERQNLVDYIHRKGIRNVLFLTGDVHSGGAVDDGTNSGFPEISVPHANMPNDWINTYCRYSTGAKLDAHSEPGLWTIGTLTEPDFGGTTLTCAGDKIDPASTLYWPTPGVYATSGKGAAGYVRVDVTATTFDAKVMTPDGKIRQGVVADGSARAMTLHLDAQ